MDPSKIVLEQKPRQKHSILTGDQLDRLWNAAITDDDTLAHDVIHQTARDPRISQGRSVTVLKGRQLKLDQ